jgi:hypothetical protein
MVAMETIHHMKCKVRGKMGEVALKIDISKAYDRVDWRYLLNVMKKMGFCERWIKWIQMCLESDEYSVMVNGEKVGPISPGRGLRQGDPLSPYLFILCAEGLTSLIKKYEARVTFMVYGRVEGPPASHTYYLLMTVSYFLEPMFGKLSV